MNTQKSSSFRVVVEIVFDSLSATNALSLRNNCAKEMRCVVRCISSNLASTGGARSPGGQPKSSRCRSGTICEILLVHRRANNGPDSLRRFHASQSASSTDLPSWHSRYMAHGRASEQALWYIGQSIYSVAHRFALALLACVGCTTMGCCCCWPGTIRRQKWHHLSLCVQLTVSHIRTLPSDV